MYEDDPFSKAVAQAAGGQVKQAGFDVVLDEFYSGSTTDFSPIINKVISAKADALVGGGHYADGATLARQLHDQNAGLKWVTLLVAPDSPNSPRSATRRWASRCRRTGSRRSAFKPEFGPTPAEFTKAFTDKYKIEPGYHAAGGYAAGLILQPRSNRPAPSIRRRSRRP